MGLKALHDSTRLCTITPTTVARTTEHVKAPNSSTVDNDNAKETRGRRELLKKKKKKHTVLKLQHVWQMGHLYEPGPHAHHSLSGNWTQKYRNYSSPFQEPKAVFSSFS